MKTIETRSTSRSSAGCNPIILREGEQVRLREAAAKLVSMAHEQMSAFNALLGLAAVKDALNYWRTNRLNNSEEFWQCSISERIYVLH
jgi:hypothetical protein